MWRKKKKAKPKGKIKHQGLRDLPSWTSAEDGSVLLFAKRNSLGGPLSHDAPTFELPDFRKLLECGDAAHHQGGSDEDEPVRLCDIMASPEFARIDSQLRIALGKAADGTMIVADLAGLPHLLIGGTTGSGKTVCLQSIIACLLLQYTPDDVQFIMVDTKGVELTRYNGIPHLVAPVIVSPERVIGALQWVQREMDERCRALAAVRARSILDYNHKVSPGQRRMPYYVVVVDELAGLMWDASDELMPLFANLVWRARPTGIHLVIGAQRPSVDVLPGRVKAGFPARISFAVTSSADSRIILGQTGAEKLHGRGSMLFRSPTMVMPVQLRGALVSEGETARITRFWKGLI